MGCQPTEALGWSGAALRFHQGSTRVPPGLGGGARNNVDPESTNPSYFVSINLGLTTKGLFR